MYAGLNKAMPFTMAALLISAFSMIGIPPTAGFFSKMYLTQGAIAAGHWYYAVVIIVGSLLSAVYFFKVLEQVFLKNQEGDLSHIIKEKKLFWELPSNILIPIVIMATGVILLGIFNQTIITSVLQYAIPVTGGGL